MKKTLIAAALFLAVPFAAFAAPSSTVSIDLTGGSVTIQQGAQYIEPGYSALSSVDGDITSQVAASTVSTAQVGTTGRTYTVTDSLGTIASAFRSISVFGIGGTAPFCSSPLAPGWNVSLPDGGCGSSSIQVPYNSSIIFQGHLYTCPAQDIFKNGCQFKKQ